MSGEFTALSDMFHIAISIDPVGIVGCNISVQIFTDIALFDVTSK